jgi:diacylglycerol kinase (ATP)
VKERAEIPVALLAAGTGNDFAKTLGTPAHDFDAMARMLAEGHVRRVDVGRADDRIFLNCLGFGFDAVVCEALQRPTMLRGRAVYIATALRELFQYRGLPISIDDGPTERRLMLTFSNGQWFGGTFVIAPGASPSDGSLDVTSIDDATPLRRAALFAKAFRGTHVHAPEVVTMRVAGANLRFNEPPVFEADGDFGRAATRNVRIETLSRVLRVVAIGSGTPTGSHPAVR